MPSISVIVPAYNASRTIQETIESVFNQTCSDFELLVINDGSQDTTAEIVSNIQDPRLKLFSYSNAGVSAARNRGLAKASGEFVAFLDADDLWTPDKLAAQLAALQANPQAAVAYSWVDNIDESGHFLSSGWHICASGDIHAQLLMGNFIQSCSNNLIRREALSTVGGFEESLSPAEDWDIWLRLASRYPFVALPQIHVLYRRSGNSASSNLSKLATGSLKVIERNCAQSPSDNQGLRKRCIAQFYRCMTFRALSYLSGRQRGWVAAQYFWRSVITDPSVWSRSLVLISVLKMTVALFLPSFQLSRSPVK